MTMLRPVLALLLAFALALPAARPARAADLSVSIVGLRSTSGVVRIALYDDARRFPDDGGQVADLVVPARELANGVLTGRFENLRPGRYAMVVFHDENANKEMDTDFIGLPVEGYGFSNDATPFLSAPPFGEAAFEVGERGGAVRLRILY